jgi:RHS repeat-associated protein
VDPNGSHSVTPTDTTTYTLTAEGIGDPATAEVTVTIENSAPVADPQTVSTDEDVSLVITLTASDVDDDSLSYTVTTEPGNGTLSGSPPNLTYTPNADFNGPDAFSFTASDGTTTSEAATVNITVKSVNDAPVANEQTVNLFEDQPVDITLSAGDVEGDALTYDIVEGPTYGDLSGDAPTLTYTPHENYSGNDSFSFKANDGQIDSDSALVALNITPVNDAPVADAGQDREVFIGDLVTLDGGGSVDVDNDSLIFSWTLNATPGNSNAALSGGSTKNPSFTPDLAGSYEVELIVNDGKVDSPPDEVVITAIPKMVNVPDVVGWPQAEAEAEIVNTKLVVGTITNDHSETVPEGSVISQKPVAGTSVEENSAVDLTISLGSINQPPAVNFSASPSSIEQGQSSSLSWDSLRAESAHIDHSIGPVAVEGDIVVSPEHTTTYTITVTGPTGSANAKVTVEVIASPEPQPEGSYGEQYDDLTPEDATVDQYDPERFALITGLVNDIDQRPLPGVTITIHNHADYGSVITDDQGHFSIPVEGGGTLIVVYQKQGLIPIQRKVFVSWNDKAIADTVVMISEDPVATTVTFDGDADTIVVHKSQDVVDAAGKRAVTMVFKGDNKAYLMDEAGNDVQELTTVTTRATEYQSPEAMPAKLPPNSAFTYCAEFSVDGVERVRFDKPVTIFLDNFLGFPVGSIVPVGYYDRDRGVWEPSENGVVVQLLDTNADGAVDGLDADGDGQPDDLDGDGSIENEIDGLDDKQRYTPDTTFCRVEIKHLSPIDINWPFGPPTDAIASNAEGTAVVDQQNNTSAQQLPGDRKCIASFVEQRSRVFHEDIPIPGTNMTLHYTSSRVPGYKPGVISIPASGDTVPESLLKIVVEVNVAGKKYKIELPPEPNQIAEVEWDGLDHLGRPVGGTVKAYIKIGFVYKGVFYLPSTVGPAFGQAGSTPLEIPTRMDVTLWRDSSVTIDRGAGSLAEGWTLAGHHRLNPANPAVLFKGDGTIIRNNVRIIDTVAGNGTQGYSGDGVPATEAQLNATNGMTLDAAGNLYICDWYVISYHYLNYLIRKLDPDGIITTITTMLKGSRDVAVDPAGNLYVSAHLKSVVQKVDPNGVKTIIAGGGNPSGGIGDGGPATEAALYGQKGIKLDALGNLYIADHYHHRIRKVDTNGIITTIAGNGTRGYSGDGGPATEAQLTYPDDVTADADGNVYIAESSYIRKVDKAGIITTVAGDGTGQNWDDGIPAIEASLADIMQLEVDTVGNLYFTEPSLQVVRKVDTMGIITTICGEHSGPRGTPGYSGDGGPATDALLKLPYGLAVDPAGNVYINDRSNYRIRKISAPSMRLAASLNETDIAFAEESGIGYIISSAGLHIKTIDLQTGITLYEFGYNQEDQLQSIIDQFGNTIIIERDAVTGVPAAIISPDGIRTELTIDENDHLRRVTYADGSFYDFEYTSDGLMLKETEPAGNVFDHIFDDKGRLTDIRDGEDGHWIYSRVIDASSESQTEVLSAEGNLTTFFDQTDSTGKYTSTIIDPTEAVTVFEQSDDGLTEKHSLPCGTYLEYIYDLDSEYKYKYAKQVTESTPAGLEKLTTIYRTYTDTDENEIADLIVATVTVNDKATVLEHNSIAAQKTVVSPEGRALTSLYDPATLQVESVIVSGLYPTNYTYDSRGRLTSISTNTRSSSFTYTAEGFLESLTDPEGRTTSYAYDPIGRMTGINRPDGNYVDFSYDANGNMTVLVNPAGTEHIFGFNQVNRNSSYTTPLSGSYSYVYDKDRRLIQTNFPSNRQISNTYENGRLTQTQTPEGNIDYSYACGTKIESITKDAESITYEYDGKLVTSETIDGTLVQSLSYTYNNDFDVTAFSYAGGTTNFTYDNDGLLNAAGSFAISRNVDNGLPEAVTSNAFNLTRTFNGYAEVEGQGVSVGGTDVASWNLTRDKNGRITQKTETIAGTLAEYSYTYDPMGRLLDVTKDGTTVEKYSYDPNGTRNYEMNALRAIAGRTFTYSEEDHLLTAGTTTYQYDLDGFLTTKTHHLDPDNPDDPVEVTSYTYSSHGELLSVTLPDKSLIEYVHDPLGRRIAKKVNGTITEKYLWQDLTRLLAVYDGSDNLLMRFEYADDRMPMAVTTEGVTYYLVYDQVGSLRMLADSVGNMVKKIGYDSFGNIIAESNEGLKIPFGFAGGLHDRHTGLVRFGYRDYDPDIGRWTAKDPIFFAGGDTDLYGYVLSDPVNFVDPIGLFFPFGGPGFTNVKRSEPPSWYEQQQKYPSPVKGVGEGVNMHNAIPGQFAVLGPAAIIELAPHVQRGVISPILNSIRYGTPLPIIINPELLEELLKPSNADAAETPKCP